MITKSIRLTEDEARQLREYVRMTGEVEANVLKRAAMKGLRGFRMERAILHYLEHGSASEAAHVADVPPVDLIHELMDRKIPMLRDRSLFHDELEDLAEELQDEELAAIVRQLRSKGTR